MKGAADRHLSVPGGGSFARAVWSGLRGLLMICMLLLETGVRSGSPVVSLMLWR